MWLPFVGAGDDDEEPGALGSLVTALVAPVAAMLLHLALSRRRELDADDTGARLLGTGLPLARALAKIDRAARVVPMDVDPEQSAKYIVNPLAGRPLRCATLFSTHPPTDQRIARLASGTWRNLDGRAVPGSRRGATAGWTVGPV
jgi:heat shock protein HtpX